MKNAILTQGVGRRPRGLIKINGFVMPPSWDSVTWEENEFAQPDTFDLRLAMSALPPARDLAWWADIEEVEVEIFAGFPVDPANYSSADLESVFLGRADDLDFNWETATLSVTGRDFTAKLMDHKTSEKYVNLTASQIASKLAAKYGLEPKITATKEKAGKYYQIDHVDLKAERTEWDLLTWLARQEQFAVFVRRKALHFQPLPTGKQDPYVLQYTPPAIAGGPRRGNFETLTTGRSLTVAKGVEVTVQSWNSAKKTAYKRKSTRLPKSGRKGDVQKYSYNIAGLTPAQAQARADQIRDEISRHERRLTTGGPADNLLTIDDAVRLQGTGTAFDQIYYPASIVRTLTPAAGYDWTVSLKNHSPESTPTL